MSPPPTVSVIVPTYDRADALPRAVDSALAQDVEALEVIVVDDGSTDDTEAVIESYDAEAVRYLHQENAGANAARNRGIEAATGEYVSFLDSDDELLPGHLSAAIDAIEAAPPRCRGAVTADVSVEDGRVRKVNRPGPNGALLTVDDVRDGNVVGGFSSTTFERDVFEDVGPLAEEMAAAQDYEFFLRYLRRFDLRCVEDVLVRSYLDADNISFDPSRKRRANEQLRARHGDLLSDERIASQQFAEGIAHARAGDLAAGRAAFRRSLRLQPTVPRYLYFYLASLLGERLFDACYWLPYRARAMYHSLQLRRTETAR